MRRRVDPASFGAILAALWAAHDVADHVLQTDHQAARKADPDPWGWSALAGHVGSYTGLQLATLAGLRTLAGVRPSWRRILAAVAVSAGTHALLDRRWPVRWLLEHTGSPRFAQATIPGQAATVIHPVLEQDGVAVVEGRPLPLHGPYLADQALHHAALAITAGILAGGRG